MGIKKVGDKEKPIALFNKTISIDTDEKRSKNVKAIFSKMD
ncbi:hypothetical protein [Aquimarina sp. I32.4]|nr:hypothetical protein [Aquimarina sp. I32.4]